MHQNANPRETDDRCAPLHEVDATTSDREEQPGQYARSGGIRRQQGGISSRLAQKRRTSSSRGVLMLGALAGLALWIYVGAGAGLMALGATIVLGIWMALRSGRHPKRK